MCIHLLPHQNSTSSPPKHGGCPAYSYQRSVLRTTFFHGNIDVSWLVLVGRNTIFSLLPEAALFEAVLFFYYIALDRYHPQIPRRSSLPPLRSFSPASDRRKTLRRRSGMEVGWSTTMAVVFCMLSIIYEASSQPLIELKNERQISDRFSQPSSLSHGALTKEEVFCGSWKFSVEANDAGMWTRVPERCVIFVRDYMTQGRYISDMSFVARNSLDFAKSVKLIGNGKDAWVFDIDETLLSNFPYYESHGLGSTDFDEKAFNKWVDMAEAPALHSSLGLYRDIRRLGFTVFLLTGRTESQRNVTETNLLSVGYSHWKKLILRGAESKGKTATLYKSEKRKEIEEEGYKIHGSSGDQWSDLFGFSIALRSFKLPNPMYFIA